MIMKYGSENMKDQSFSHIQKDNGEKRILIKKLYESQMG